jgi:hypothetical protein
MMQSRIRQLEETVKVTREAKRLLQTQLDECKRSGFDWGELELRRDRAEAAETKARSFREALHQIVAVGQDTVTNECDLLRRCVRIAQDALTKRS